MLTELVNLGVTIMTSGNAVIGAGCLDLPIFQPAVFQARFFVSGLQKTAATAAAVIIGAVRLHVDKVFFPHNGFHHETQIFRDGIPVAFAYDLTGILNREFDLEVLVPIGIDLQFVLPDPFGVVFIDVLDLKIMGYLEFFQSCQD